MFNTTLSLLANITEGIENLYVEQHDLEGDISSFSLRVVGASALALFVMMGIAIISNGRTERLKLPLFVTMAFVMAGSTLLLAISTIYLNVQSDSGGPVHWHADIEFWVCDNEIELVNPEGFSNKVGTWTLHEHNDHRIHLEGVVVDDRNDASLGKFMSVIGGAITDDALIVPVNPEGTIFEDELDGDGPSNAYPIAASELIKTSNGKRYVKALSGQSCDGETSEVQVFVYKFNKDDDTYEQTKISNPQQYSISPEAIVPPGDCIIVEFGPSKEKTNKLCEQYGTRDEVRCVEFGVSPDRTYLCTIKQINYTPIGTGSDPNVDIKADEHFTEEHLDDGHSHDDGGSND